MKPLKDRYQRKTQHEHILIRPDSYIGSVEITEKELWIKSSTEEKLIKKKIKYVPGLYKIFDEILVNAADNYQRDSKKTKNIKIFIDQKEGYLSVYNDGMGIPNEIHEDENMYISEMIFGELLTGSNFDDDEDKVTGGRNGFGAKLANIYSNKFSVETGDPKQKNILKVTWTKNMTKKHKLKFLDNKEKKSFTRVSFYPDFKRFNLEGLTDDIYNLFCKRVYDIAGSLKGKVNVFLNDNKLPINSFDDYVDFYLKDEDDDVMKLKFNIDRWNIVLSNSQTGSFEHISFVNCINTIRGGTHVNYLADQVIEKLIKTIKKLKPKLTIRNSIIKNNLFIFVNCLIKNPSFDSQTKETLTTKISKFGSKCEFSDKFLKKLMKTGLIEQIIFNAELKENMKLKRKMKGTKKSRVLGIEKLEDANLAGTKNSKNCLLILTEGDSAKSLAMAGLEIIGRDNYGVFPLKGKLLNTRMASTKQILENKEVQNIIKIIGLQAGKRYDSIDSLRYGGIMIMTDQDVDGSHIKGLIINFISFFWPSLIEKFDFLKAFITPIIKIFKGKEVKSFYTLKDYEDYAKDIDINKWRIKYYKGLGTSTDKEGREYFSDLDKHRKNFKYIDNQDLDCIDLLFNKKKADQRKEWLKIYDENTVLDSNLQDVRYKDFIDKELIHFSVYDCKRSIPSLCDGLKPGQRKILFSCFKKNLKKEIKVAQLTGYVSENSAYHHGEVSLQSTIVKLAQNFVGSNNINLLKPIGQFGTRAMGGKDAASARYIHTSLNEITRKIFIEKDDFVLDYTIDDGQVVEPKYYLPIIPMILVNGCSGIGTGWSSNIPNFNPREIAKNILNKINGEDFFNMIPFYKGFKGVIKKNETKKSYDMCGESEAILANNLLKITELPIGKWTSNYKNFLEKKMMNDDMIVDMKEYHTTKSVDFEIILKEDVLTNMYRNKRINKVFKLDSSIAATNYVLFDSNDRIKLYKDEIEILEEYFVIRLNCYKKRKAYEISKIIRDMTIINNKLKFIIYVIEEKIILRNKKRKVIIENLIEYGFDKQREFPKINSSKLETENNLLTIKEGKNEENEKNDENEEEEDIELEDNSKQFNYLLNMNLWSLTYEQVEKLKEQNKKKETELKMLENYDYKDMWRNDLKEFLIALDNMEKLENKENEKEDKKFRKRFNKVREKNRKKGMKKKKKNKKKDISPEIIKVKKNKSKKQKKKRDIKKISKKSNKNEKKILDIEEIKKKSKFKLTLEEKLFLNKYEEDNKINNDEKNYNKEGSTSRRKFVFSDSEFE